MEYRITFEIEEGMQSEEIISYICDIFDSQEDIKYKLEKIPIEGRFCLHCDTYVGELVFEKEVNN